MYNLVGQRFYRLVVINSTNERKWGSKVWECLCDCGNKLTVITVNLIRNHVKSCGCLKSETSAENSRKSHKLPDELAILRRVYAIYRNSARNRNIEFLLSENQIKELIFQKCYYCEKMPTNRQRFNHRADNILYGGIDRVDNSKGYIKGNVVPCCKECNSLKLGVSVHIAKKIMEFTNAN